MGRKTRCRKTDNFIKSHDLFGHPLEINFNNNGSVHNTTFGGSVSLLTVKLLMVIYIYILIKKLVSYGDDAISRDLSLTDPKTSVKMSDTSNIVHFRFVDASSNYGKPDPELQLKDVSKYLDIFTLNRDINIKTDKVYNDGEATHMKPCEASDFDKNNHTKEYWKSLGDDPQYACIGEPEKNVVSKNATYES